jgi:hypothetical protein
LLGPQAGAYVNTLVWCSSRAEYLRAAADACEAFEFEMVGASEIEPLERRLRRRVLDPDLLALAKETAESRAARFHTFYS